MEYQTSKIDHAKIFRKFKFLQFYRLYKFGTGTILIFKNGNELYFV